MQIIKRTIPQTNYTKGRQGKSIQKVVLHWFGIGTLASADARFMNPASIVSAHYGISGDTVYQWVDEADTSYGAGDWNTNLIVVNIEHDATTTKNASNLTYSTSANLIALICQRYSIPPDRKHILKHSEIVPTQCCGTLDIDKIVSYVQYILENSCSPSISPSRSPSCSKSPSTSPSISPSASPSFSPSVSTSISPSEEIIINYTWWEIILQFILDLFRSRK